MTLVDSSSYTIESSIGFLCKYFLDKGYMDATFDKANGIIHGDIMFNYFIFSKLGQSPRDHYG